MGRRGRPYNARLCSVGHPKEKSVRNRLCSVTWVIHVAGINRNLAFGVLSLELSRCRRVV